MKTKRSMLAAFRKKNGEDFYLTRYTRYGGKQGNIFKDNKKIWRGFDLYQLDNVLIWMRS